MRVKRLKADDIYDIQTQYDAAMDTEHGSGEHFILIGVLSQKGFRVNSVENLFLSKEQNKIIIVPYYVIDVGFYYEQDTPKILPFDNPTEDIGLQSKVALIACDRGPANLAARKLADWPSYKASKAKSVKIFQANYLPISLVTVNANLRLEGVPIGSEQVFVGAYMAPGGSNKDLGNLILNIYESCLQLSSTNP